MIGIGIDPNPEKSISDEDPLAKLQDDFLRSLLEKGDPAAACELDEIIPPISIIRKEVRS
jgi:hypothetical protein